MKKKGGVQKLQLRNPFQESTTRVVVLSLCWKFWPQICAQPKLETSVAKIYGALICKVCQKSDLDNGGKLKIRKVLVQVIPMVDYV